ncbi:MAG: GNAT family N-acetyltransferase [Anaerolineae bacterium]|nr:GNAT family N-acetyltransferase [Anaerolineae bacterium]
MYFLHTRRLGFRPWAEADLDLAVGLWGDENVTRFIGGPFSVDQIRERLAREMDNLHTYRVQYWPLFLLDRDEFVGCCGLRPYRDEQSVYEIGFHLRRAYWSQGLAVEAAWAVMEYAFHQLKATVLSAGHHPANVASRRVLEKLGFQYTHDEFYPPTGLQHPTYRLTAEEFAEAVDTTIL